MHDNATVKTAILVAEDDAGVRKFVTTVLEGKGYEVIGAADGSQALRRARAYAGEIGFLLTDVEMGKKLDGFDLRERLLQERPAVKVVVMSGRLGPEILGEDFPVLRKPFSPQELIEAIEGM
jgi:CheY-like chemotaxis protein